MSRTHLAYCAALLATLGACRIDRAGLATAGGGARDAGAAVDATGVDAPVALDAGRDEDGGPADAFVPPVDAGPCPGDGDSDDDGSCDGEDACPGSDDEADEDGDGVPDGCDPCRLDGPGADPIPSSATGSGITIDGVQLNGAGNVLVVDPGDTVRIRFAYEIQDCGCPGCRDQIEVGFVPGDGVTYCAYDGVPACGGDTGTDTTDVTAPTTPGEYWIRFGLRQDYGCGDDWWQGEPPEERTLGALCVR